MRSSRRQFVGGLSAASALLGLSPLVARPALGQSAGGARNLVVFFSPNGTIPSRLGAQAAGGLSFAAGGILEPLAPVANDVVFLNALDIFCHGSSHEAGMRAMLTGENSAGLSESEGMSVDQFVASRIGQASRFASLELGVQTSAWGGSVQTRMSYRGPSTFVAPDDQPRNVYNRLFADLAGGATGLEKLRRRRQSVLDLVRTDLADVARRVSAVERHKLDVHTESLRSIERSLDAQAGGDGGTCAAPVAPTLVGEGQNDDFPVVVELQRQLGVLALACGMTRVVSLQCSHTVSPTLPSWLGINDGHHSLSHNDDGNAAGVANFVLAERYFAEEFKNLIVALKAQPSADGSGTLLDDTIVVYAKEMGDSRLHNQVNVPFIVAGGGIAGGRLLECNHAPHNRLLVSVCQALGIDVDTFGDPDAGAGGLGGLL